MTRHIVVAIEPHEDGVRCGECEDCDVRIEMGLGHWARRDKSGAKTRGPACLAAEAKLTALISAGEDMIAAWDEDTLEHEAWDRAVAEVKK